MRGVYVQVQNALVFHEVPDQLPEVPFAQRHRLMLEILTEIDRLVVDLATRLATARCEALENAIDEVNTRRKRARDERVRSQSASDAADVVAGERLGKVQDGFRTARAARP